jgi:hypothetical protein
MKQFKHVLTAAMLAFAVTACDEGTGGTTEPEPVLGTVSGAVTVEGSGAGGVSVGLSGEGVQQVTVTDGNGAYTFPNIPEGSYVVSITPPEGTTFSQTAQAVSITATNPGATAGFAGEFVRTSAISGTVSSAQGPLPGVQVGLSGDESRSTQTSASGGYSFTGLKAGTYTVTITPPANVDFDVTSQSVTLGTGDAEVVSFTGTLPLQASVAIKSVTVGNTLTPVNPNAVAGLIDITVTLADPGNQVRELSVLVDGEACTGCTQSFSAPGDMDSPDLAPSGEYIFTLNTAEFANDGSVTYENGPRDISVEASTATEETVASGVSLTFANADFFAAGGSTSVERTALGPAGLTWFGGDVTVEIVPVIYSGGTVASVSVAWQNVNGVDAGCPAASTDTEAPFVFAYPNTASGAACDLAGYQSPGGTANPDNFNVVGATYAGGTAAAGLPVTALTAAVDNVAPTPGVLNLPTQSLASDCCFNSYTNAEHTWASGHGLVAGGSGTAPTDAGVGGIGATWHAGAATLTTAQLAALDPSTDASGLAESGTNGAYSVVAVVTDALENAATLRLAVNGPNTAANALGATFGIDNTAPTAAYAAGSVGDMTINPAGSYIGAATDAGTTASGFGPTPWRARLYGNFSMATVGTGTGTNCFYGTAAGGMCQVALSNGTDAIPVAAADESYWTDERWVIDAAGNKSVVLTRTHLDDLTIPTVSNVAIPASITGWAPTTYTATAADNVDLAFNQPSNFYAGFTSFWQMGPGMQIGPGFVDPPITAATISETFNQVVGVESSTAGNLPANNMGSATSVRFVVNDVAGNLSAQVNTYAAGTVPAGTSFVGTGTTGALLSAPAAPVNICNGLGAVACPAGTNTSATVTYTTTGPSGTYAWPCTGELRLYQFDGVSVPTKFDLIGTFGAPSLTDTGAVRTWSASTVYDGLVLPAGNV